MMKEIDALRKENAVLKDQVSNLQKRIQELEASKKPSKSRQDAEAGLKMLQDGPVTTAQLATLNPKYPSDVIYNVRKLLGVAVHTVRTQSGTLYMTEQHFTTYQAEKQQKSESVTEATEEVLQAQTQTAAASVTA
jgi:hypothetical protein